MSNEILMLLNNIKYQIFNEKKENFSVESDEVARLESLKYKIEQLQIKIRDSEVKLNQSKETKPLTELNTTTQTQEAVEKIKWVFIAIGSFFGLLFLLTIGYWIYSMTQSNTSVSNTYSESISEVVSVPKSIVANTPKFVDFEESRSKPTNIESIQKSASIPVESNDYFSSFFNQTSKPVQNTLDTSSNAGISVTKSFSNNLENTSRSPQTSIGFNKNIYDENTGISNNLYTKNIYDDSYRSINDTFDYPKNNNKLSGGKKMVKKIK